MCVSFQLIGFPHRPRPPQTASPSYCPSAAGTDSLPTPPLPRASSSASRANGRVRWSLALSSPGGSRGSSRCEHTYLLLHEPLVQAVRVEEVSAVAHLHLLLGFDVAQADAAFVFIAFLLLVLLLLLVLFVLMVPGGVGGQDE